MKILLYKKTPLARNPDLWSLCLGRYTDHEVYLALHSAPKFYFWQWSKEKNSLVPSSTNVDISKDFDIIHFNDKFIAFDGYEKKSIMHYHSINTRTHTHFKGKRIANAPHVFNGFYNENDVEPIKWFPIQYQTPIYNCKNPTDKIRICYTPSNRNPLMNNGEIDMFTKGFKETHAILNKLKIKYGDRFSFVTLTGTSKENVLLQKNISNVIIDECVTGNYHMSGLEGLAMGKMVIGYCNEQNINNAHKIFPSATPVPYENVRLNNLESYLDNLISDPNSMDYICSKGVENRKWMEENWALEDIIHNMLQIYERVLSGHS